MSRRTDRIGKLMQQVIGQIILRQLSDPRIAPARTSVTRVEVQEDLLRAKVYISILGTDGEQSRGLAALQHAAGKIHRLVRGEISLRHIPTLEILYDERHKSTLKTWEVIRQAMAEIEQKQPTATEGEDEDEESNESAPDTEKPDAEEPDTEEPG